MPRFRYDATRGTFRSYLRTITQRKVVDHFRRESRRPSIPLDHDDEGTLPVPATNGRTAEAIWEREWRRNLLQACLDRIRHEVEPKTFQAFQLYALDGWSASDTAAFLKMSSASVYAAKSRILERIRIWVDNETREAEGEP